MWVVAVLTALAAVTARVSGTRQERAAGWAVLRAVVQLAGVGLVIATVLRTPGLAPLYLALMIAVAAWTSSRRVGGGRAVLAVCAAAIVAGAGTAVGAVLAGGALPLQARTAVPFAAQLIGGSMTATTLAGQRLVDDVVAGWDLVEGRLALGATPYRAVRPMARTAAARALTPALDQTRNVGLVVLPGAYVGLLLAGASPVQAGQVQLLVLAGLLAAETVSAAVVTRLLAARLGTRRPETR